MATISKTKFGTFRVQVRRNGQPHLNKTFKSKKDAETWALEKELEINTGTFINRTEAEKMYFSYLVDRYIEEVSPSKKGHQQELPRLKHIKRTLGDYHVLQIQSKHIANYRDQRSNLGKSNSAVLNELSLISQIFDHAIKEWGVPLPNNPCRLIKKPRPDKGRDRRLKDGEEDRLLAHCERSRALLLKPLVIIALETGMRLSELLSLTWDRIDTRKRTALLTDTKNGDKRVVPLSLKALHTLQTMPININSNRVFWTWTAKDGVENVWRRTCKKALIDDLHLHDLRHEATSRFFEKGLNMMEVASITGHKSLQMLKRYTHLKAEDLAIKLG